MDFNQPENTAVYDELPLWSAMFGLLMLKHLPMRHLPMRHLPMRHLRMRRGQTVLDLGYGTGFPLLELAERLGSSCKVYGIDPWETARQRALQKARIWQVGNVELLPGDAAALPFPDGMFDLIVSNLGLNNFSDPAAALRECSRVARPGARLALTTNLQGHMQEFYDVFETTLRELGREEILPALHLHIAHRASLPGLTAQLEQAGFRLTAVHEETTRLRFLDGSAFLRHHFIRIGFLDAWKALVDEKDWPLVCEGLEGNLNHLAEENGELALTIPMAYVEGECEEP